MELPVSAAGGDALFIPDVPLHTTCDAELYHGTLGGKAVLVKARLDQTLFDALRSLCRCVRCGCVCLRRKYLL